MTEGVKGRKPSRLTKPHNRTARIGAKLRTSTEDSLEVVFDFLATRMRRSEIIRAYAMTVDSRARGAAEWDAAAPEKRKGLRPTPLRPLKNSAIDDLIAAAKARMIASVNPKKAEESRAELVTYLRRAQKRMASEDTATAMNVGVNAAMAEAKLTGLVVDRVEGVHALKPLEGADGDRLAEFLASLPGSPSHGGRAAA